MCDHNIDPTGDVVLTILSPGEVLAPFLDPGSSGAGVSGAGPSTDQEASDAGNNGGGTPNPPVTFRVSSEKLTTGEKWTEARPTAEGEYHVATSGWSAEVMEIILASMHGAQLRDMWDVRLSLEQLAEMAVMADYYDVRGATLRLLYQVQKIDLYTAEVHHLGSDKNLLSRREIALWVCAAWVFAYEDTFVRMAQRVLMGDVAEFSTEGLPVPGAIIDKINMRQEELVAKIFSTLLDLLKELEKGQVGCHAACRAAQIGVLRSTMAKTGLMMSAPEHKEAKARASLSSSLPPRLANVLGILKTIQSPDWQDADRLPPHQCIDLKPNTISTKPTTSTSRSLRWYRPLSMDQSTMDMEMRTTTMTKPASVSSGSDGMHAISTRIAALVADVNKVISEDVQADFKVEFAERRRRLARSHWGVKGIEDW